MKETMRLFYGLHTLRVSLSLVCIFGAALAQPENKFPKGTYSNGQFAITFQDDGTHTVKEGDNVVVKGTYKITGDQIVLSDKEGQYACEGEGKYKWKAEGNALRFEKVEDGCDGRANALTEQQWIKK